MYDLDHMLNGKGSRNHHQDMIRQAQQAKVARDLKNADGNHKAIAPLRFIRTAMINLWPRSAPSDEMVSSSL